MIEKKRTKLVIKIGAVQAEGDQAHLVLDRVLHQLKALRDELHNHYIDTTITVSGIDLDQFESRAEVMER